MNVIELFAGAGGAALGLHRAGYEHRAMVELDSAACKTLRATELGAVIETDVRNLDLIEAIAFVSEDEAWHRAGDELLDEDADGEEWTLDREALAEQMLRKDRVVDLLWSSWPCQDWSIQGSQQGCRGDRNGWPWTVDAIDRFRPRWFLGENVAGLRRWSDSQPGDVSVCRRTYFDRVILRQLQERFAHVGWFVLNAADFGLPQHRRRLFVWAGPAPVAAPAPTHCDPKHLAQVGLFGSRLSAWTSFDWWDGPTPTVCANENKGHTRPDVDRGRAGATSRLSDAWYLSTGGSVVPLAIAAAAQGFPEAHPWKGKRTEKYRQVGNAVPPVLAEVVGRAVMQADTLWREAVK